MRPGCSAGERRGPVPVPLSNDAAVVGTGKRGEIMSGAPSGVAGDLSGVPRLGMAGDNSRWVSAAADAANLLHSSSQAKNLPNQLTFFHLRVIRTRVDLGTVLVPYHTPHIFDK